MLREKRVVFYNAIHDEGYERQRKQIEAAIPKAAPAKPLKPRRLLIFDLNIGYGGHRSIVYANLAFETMGRKTGAYEAVVCHDLSMFSPEKLRQFDAVCFNNTVCFNGTMGTLFEQRGLKKSLVEFVRGGGGLMGIHGATATFLGWPEYGRMLGAYLAGHPWNRETVTIELDDPGHPLNAPFGGQGFQIADEIFQFKAPYSRDHLRVLLSLDTVNGAEKVSGKKGGRKDGDYGISWVKNYGKGRVFHLVLGHDDYSVEGVGFIVSLTRGTEWAATGKVTIPIPDDFPTAEKATTRKFELEK